MILICFAGNLVGQIVDRMKDKTNNETILIPGTNLVLYSAVSSEYLYIMCAYQGHRKQI